MNIDWNKLTFHYTETDYIVRAAYKNGVWEQPYATRDKMIPCLLYTSPSPRDS